MAPLASVGRTSAARRCVRILVSAGVLLVLFLGYRTWRDPHFWVTAQQRGDWLLAAGEYKEAAEAYADPWHVGVAQYRNGDFTAAARTFARVPGAAGAFDRGNAWLMHGDYESAIDSYDRALGLRPGWAAAADNKALAQARKQRIDDAGANREQESAGAYDPDATVADEQGEDEQDEAEDMNSQQLSDAELRATWLRRVQTTPADFLRAKFAYQAARDEQQAAPDTAGGPS